MSMPAGGRARSRPRWTAWVNSTVGWVYALGILGAILLIPALCAMGLIIDRTGARQDHPILRRLGDGAGALVLAAVCFAFGLAFLAGFRRMWRLRLHGETTRGEVLRRYSIPGDEGASGIEHAVVQAGFVTVDVALLSRRPPREGDPIRIRYDPANPANAVHAHWSVTSVIATVVAEVFALFFGGGGIALGLFFLYAFVEVIK
jgi:hypothetical protein